MGLFGRDRGSLATVGGQPLRCLVCGAGQFRDREVKLNSSGAELFDLGWANESATGLICLQCGHVHAFVGDAVKLWDPEGGYPSGQEAR